MNIALGEAGLAQGGTGMVQHEASRRKLCRAWPRFGGLWPRVMWV